MNNNQILSTGMILSWPPLERRDPCVLRHHLQLPFTVPQHNKSGYETAVLLQELHRWKAQEIPPLPHLQRPCRRLSPLPALYSLSLQMTPARPGGQTQPLRSLLQRPPCRQSSHLRLQSWPNVSPRHTGSKITHGAEWAAGQKAFHKLLPTAGLWIPPVQHKRHGKVGIPEFPSSCFWL